MTAASAIDATMLTSALGFEEVIGDGERVAWVERRPSTDEIVLRAEHGDLLPDGFEVATELYEYGDGAAAIQGDTVVFTDRASQRVHAARIGRRPVPITAAGEHTYGDLAFDQFHGRVVAVWEDRRASTRLPNHRLVAIDSAGEHQPRVLVEGGDCCAAPRVSHDGSTLAWVEWDLPGLPWDDARLHVAPLDASGAVAGASRVVAGGDGSAAAYPHWCEDGSLLFIWDATGWYELWMATPGVTAPRQLTHLDHDIGRPTYGVGVRPFDVRGDRVVAYAAARGRSRLVSVRRRTGTVTEIDTPGITAHRDPRFAGDRIVFVGGAPTVPLGVHVVESGRVRSLRPATDDLDTSALRDPILVSLRTADGATVHAHVHPPAHGSGADAPPAAVINVHGGPVAGSTTGMSLGVWTFSSSAFWTSRGYAFVDVDYRGTMGYGRPYWRALYGRWGEVDVADCIVAAMRLADRGDIDGRRMVIRGASAGGHTVLRALATSSAFRAGCAWFPVADPATFDAESHKLESGLMGTLAGDIGRLDAAAIDAPLLVLQGDRDRVCPPASAQRLVSAIRAAGGDAALSMFPGEGHGFGSGAALRRALELEEAFFERVLAIEGSSG